MGALWEERATGFGLSTLREALNELGISPEDTTSIQGLEM